MTPDITKRLVEAATALITEWRESICAEALGSDRAIEKFQSLESALTEYEAMEPIEMRSNGSYIWQCDKSHFASFHEAPTTILKRTAQGHFSGPLYEEIKAKVLEGLSLRDNGAIGAPDVHASPSATLSDKEMERLDSAWEKTTPKERLSYFNTLALRPCPPMNAWREREILELANYFSAQVLEDASTRKDEAVNTCTQLGEIQESSAKPSEILVVSELKELDQFLEAMRDGAYSVTDSVMIQASEHLEELRSYMTTREPGMKNPLENSPTGYYLWDRGANELHFKSPFPASLEKCAYACAEVLSQEGFVVDQPYGGEVYKVTKAVLDAAGVKYE